MSKNKTAFPDGIRLKPTEEAGTRDGELWVDKSERLLKIYLDGEIKNFSLSNSDVTSAGLSANDVIYVDGTTGDDNNNGKAGYPYKTLQHAINQATANKNILVSPGIYAENLDFNNKQNIALVALIQSSSRGVSVTVNGTVNFTNSEGIKFHDFLFDINSTDTLFTFASGVDYSGGNHDFYRCGIQNTDLAGNVIVSNQITTSIVFDNTSVYGNINLNSHAGPVGGGSFFFRDNCNISGNLNIGEYQNVTMRNSRCYAPVIQTGGFLRLVDMINMSAITSSAGVDANDFVAGTYLINVNMATSVANFSKITINSGVRYLLAGVRRNALVDELNGNRLTLPNGLLTGYNAEDIDVDDAAMNVTGSNLQEILEALDAAIGGGGGGGEVNTASNLGATGEGVFAQKVLEDLQFKKLKAGTNVSLSSDTESITINASNTGATSLNELSDVELGTLGPSNDEQVLTYDHDLGDWVPKDIPPTTPTTVSLNPSGTNIDWSAGELFSRSTTSNITFTFSNLSDKTIILAVINTSGADVTMTFPAGIKKRADISQIVSANSSSIFTFVRISGIIYLSEVKDLL